MQRETRARFTVSPRVLFVVTAVVALSSSLVVAPLAFAEVQEGGGDEDFPIVGTSGGYRNLDSLAQTVGTSVDLGSPYPQFLGGPPRDPLLDTVRVSMTFRQRSLSDCLTLLARETGVPIVFSEYVADEAAEDGPGDEAEDEPEEEPEEIIDPLAVEVTATFRDAPLGEVLGALLRPHGLDFAVRSGVVYVGALSPEHPSFATISTMSVLRTRYVAPAALRDLLPEALHPYVSAPEGGRFLTVSAPPSIHSTIREILRAADTPPEEFAIHVTLIEGSEEIMADLGFRLPGVVNTRGWVESPGEYVRGLLAEAPEGVFTVLDALRAVELSDAVEVTGRAEKRAVEGRDAVFRFGWTDYVIARVGPHVFRTPVHSEISLRISVRSFGDQLLVEVAPHSRRARASYVDLPYHHVHVGHARAVVEAGEVLLVGGFEREMERTRLQGIPVLSRIPIIGSLFSYSERTAESRSLSLFVRVERL